MSTRDKSRDDLQQNLQISVNKIQLCVSLDTAPVNELNGLLLGEGGLIQCLNEIFLHGRRVQRLRTNYAWDTICHTTNKIKDLDSDNLVFEFQRIFDEIQSKCRDAGKDGKFETFCSVLINSKSLSTFLTMIRQYSIDLYKTDEAFMYDNSAIVFMEQMNRILENQEINVDSSLTKGIMCNIGYESIASYESPFAQPESSV